MDENYEMQFKALLARMKGVAAVCESTACHRIADAIQGKDIDQNNAKSEAYFVAAGWIKENLKSFIN